MKTITLDLYSFPELSEEVQKKVLAKLSDVNTDHDWWDPIVEGWKEKLNELGYQNADIAFSGFSSQGDGASFTADLDLSKFKPRFMEATQLDFSLVSGLVRRLSSHYSHAQTCTVELAPDNDDVNADLVSMLEASIEKERERLCKELYRSLEKYYDELTTDEAIKETIEANEWTFEKDGTMCNI